MIQDTNTDFMASTQKNLSYSSPFNVTSWDDLLFILEYHIPVALALNKAITPIWYAIGLVGNVTSAAVWLSSGLRMSNTAAYYLASLAIADLLFLILQVFYELEYPWLVRALDLQGWCQIWNILNMAVGYICVLLVFGFTFERFLSICYPFKSERFSKTSRSKRVIFLIVLVSFLVALPQGYFWDVRYNGCHVRISLVMQRERSLYSIWNWGSEMIMFGLVPLVVLVLNICVLHKIKHAGQLKLGDTSASNSHKRYISTTVTLLWVSFYLILTTLPVTLMFAMQTKFTLGSPMSLEAMADDPHWRTFFSYQFARTVIKEIGLSHYACNLFIYCFTCKKFRFHLFRLLFGPGVVCFGSDDSDSKTGRQPSQSFQMEQKLLPYERSPNMSTGVKHTDVSIH
ncbi:neuropeptides capa receptor-like [Gigantopelta aegis]|uniref:neuropeptides capa receptor-like n=1 Tax=Gigantopelta aegis TaxID=1735272 RepID=UPI001B888D6C|nr:neuropeptides capa receptor-like [Gigantopelta aegis]